MRNRDLLLVHVNCHVNGTTFQSGLRFQTGLSLLRASCKLALNNNPSRQKDILKMFYEDTQDILGRCVLDAFKVSDLQIYKTSCIAI